jgi:hypothetical protein
MYAKQHNSGAFAVLKSLDFQFATVLLQIAKQVWDAECPAKARPLPFANGTKCLGTITTA